MLAYTIMDTGISNFTNINNYLPILNGAILTEVIVLLLCLFKVINNTQLNEWYKKFNITAVIADVLILVIGIILARFFYYKIFIQYSLLNFIILAVIIQTIHDILFGIFIYYFPKNKSDIMDLFKKYSFGNNFKNVFVILICDAVMIVSTILFASFLNNYTLNTNIILVIVLLYLFPYLLNSF